MVVSRPTTRWGDEMIFLMIAMLRLFLRGNTTLGLEGDGPEHREEQPEGRGYADPWLDGLHRK